MSKAKHLAFSGGYEVEILRLRLRMTLRHSLFRERARVSVFFAAILVYLVWSSIALAQLVKSVEAVGMTVSDIDRSVDFFSKVLSVEKVSDIEVHGSEYEKLQVFSEYACA